MISANDSEQDYFRRPRPKSVKSDTHYYCITDQEEITLEQKNSVLHSFHNVQEMDSEGNLISSSGVEPSATFYGGLVHHPPIPKPKAKRKKKRVTK